MNIKNLIRELVQAIVCLALVGAVIYLTAVGRIPVEVIGSLASMVVGYFVAEQKNGRERSHVEKMAAYQTYHERSEP